MWTKAPFLRPTPVLLVQKLAHAKCHAVAVQHPSACVLGCDTVVDVDGEVLGKPRDAADARRMMRLLSGRTHRVHTGVCLAVPGRPDDVVRLHLFGALCRFKRGRD